MDTNRRNTDAAKSYAKTERCDCLSEYQQFYSRICSEIEHRQNTIEPNSDRMHNAAILRAMFDTAGTIDMYCGEMSVFHQNFYDYINSQNGTCNADNGCSLGQSIKSDLIESMRKFLNRDDSKLTIYVQNPENLDFHKFIDYDLIKGGVVSGKISLNKIDKSRLFVKGIKHTTCTDRNTVRLEINEVTHEALCAVEADKSVLEPIHEMFGIMKSVSIPIAV